MPDEFEPHPELAVEQCKVALCIDENVWLWITLGDGSEICFSMPADKARELAASLAEMADRCEAMSTEGQLLN